MDLTPYVNPQKYINGKSYEAGDIVLYNNGLYECSRNTQAVVE